MRANERTDERVAQYLHLYSCLFQTTVGRLAMRSMEISNLTILEKMDFHASGHRFARFIDGAEQRLTSENLAAALRRHVPEFRSFEAAFPTNVEAGGASRWGNFRFTDFQVSAGALWHCGPDQSKTQM